MFLHLGSDIVVNMKNVIAVLDMDNTTISKTTKEFLKIAEEEGFVRVVTEDLPKSYIICEIDKKSVVYISPISSATLLKRAESNIFA